MCIAYIQFQPQSPWPFIVAANRDEFHQRPTQIAHYWHDHPNILAGRDLQAGGTWLGLNQQTRRFALVTNVREPHQPTPDHAISRGTLVQNFLQNKISASNYLTKVAQKAKYYAGFNLIVAEGLHQSNINLWYYSNRNNQAPKQLTPGTYLLSNAFLNKHWPKTLRLKQRMQQALNKSYPNIKVQNLMHVLNDRETALDAQLPNTGLSHEMEKRLSSIFIVSPNYGSRCSTIFMVNDRGHGLFCEQSYDMTGQETDRIDWPIAFN